MSNSNPSRFMAAAGGTPDYDLALKEFWPSFVEAWRTETIFDHGAHECIAKKNVSQGQSWQFLMMADMADPDVVVPGNELLGQAYAVQDGTVTLDTILASHADVPKDQYRVSHFDILPRLGQTQARKLRQLFDQFVMNTAIKAARTAAVTKNSLSVHSGGNRVLAATGASLAAAIPANATGAATVRLAMDNLAQAMDEDNVPENGRYLYITPYIRKVLAQDTTIFDIDYTRNNGNSLNDRLIGKISGFNIMVAKNRIPNTNLNSGIYANASYTKYAFNAAIGGGVGEPIAVALCGAQDGCAAVGVVENMAPSPVIEPDNRRSTVFVKTDMFMGAGILHPWMAGEIYVTT